ncbi:MAG: hypothetical protein AB7O24_16660 [Kofleriaceae bacterium]
MLTFDSLPQARVVRHSGRLVTPPPAPRTASPQFREHLRTVAAYAIGLWPLTGVMLAGFALMYMAVMQQAPR